MGRTAKGCVKWNKQESVWQVRVTLTDGKRSRPIWMTGLKACSVTPDSPAKGCVCDPCREAIAAAQRTSNLLRSGDYVDVSKVPVYEFDPIEPPGIGGVYFVRSNAPTDVAVKIGFASRSIKDRIRELGTAHPWPLDLVAYVPRALQDKEREFHRKFHNLRITGSSGREWFSPGFEIIKEIRLLRSLT